MAVTCQHTHVLASSLGLDLFFPLESYPSSHSQRVHLLRPFLVVLGALGVGLPQ